MLHFSSRFKHCGSGYRTAFLNQWDLTFGCVERQVSNIKTSINSKMYITVETLFLILFLLFWEYSFFKQSPVGRKLRKADNHCVNISIIY